MNNKILFGAIALIVVIVFMFVSNKKGGPEIAPQAIEQNPPATETATQAEEQQEAVITITSSGFEPATVNIEAGTKVVWTNKSGSTATVNSALHPTHLIYPPLNLNGVSDNESVSLVFDEQGTYKYHDHLNPTRTGTVVVE